MPWWAYIYLLIFILSTIAGIADDMKRPHKIIFISGEIISTVFVVVFISAFFDSALASSLGDMVLLMFFIGVIYELAAANRVMEDQKDDPELSERENAILNTVGLILANLIIVPGYAFGLLSWLSS